MNPFEDPPAVLFTPAEQEALKAGAETRVYPAGACIFSENDPVDFVYFVEQGTVAVVTKAFATHQELATFGPGDYFGEMALFLDNRRTASALAKEEVRLSCVTREHFLAQLARDRELASKINRMLDQRHQERLLRENLVQQIGLESGSLHVSIKGDPSLRESAFTRERYQSLADQMLPRLIPQLEQLLLERASYQWTIHFNSGEVRTATVFHPFQENAHAVEKMVNAFYFDSHFPRMDYAEKGALIRRLFTFLHQDPAFAALPAPARTLYRNLQEPWQPANPEDIRRILARIDLLRGLENFYVRNLSLSMATDLVRIQFNCDGTHLLSTNYYEQFIADNLG